MTDLATCQHCEQPVKWGKTEYGYAGFVHVATGRAACTTSATKLERDQ